MSTSLPIVVAGATGQLGARIIQELLRLGATVRALVRPGNHPAPLMGRTGVDVVAVDFGKPDELAEACRGGAVVVSASSGLGEVMVGAQGRLLAAAVAAGVPRFFPSDFAIDFMKLEPGANRNLSWRQQFRRQVDQAKIAATSVMNGAFMDMLTGQAPFVLWKKQRILCWGDHDQPMDFTTMNDTAAFTARAACESQTPRELRIAGEQISANGLAAVASEVTGERFRVFHPGGPRLFSVVIGLTKVLAPGRGQLYPAWQGMQYMRDMYEGKAKFAQVDNGRYPIQWTPVRDVLKSRGTKAP